MRKGWQLHTLGDICKMGSGGTPLTSKREYYDGGTIPWLQSGEVAQGEVLAAANFITQAGFENSAARLFPPDTVLVAMYGATAGQVGILRFEATTNQAICGIFPNDRFYPKFLYYALLSKKNELISKAVGNAQPNISQVKIKSTYIPVPPLPEQKRIVKILDNAFEGIGKAVANAEKNLANARELFNSYVATIFEKGDVDWIKTTIGAEVDLQTGFAFRSPDYTNDLDDVRLLRGDNIVQGELRWGDVKRWLRTDRAAYSEYELEENDIVLAMDRTWVKAGIKFARISRDDVPALLVQRVARMRCRKALSGGLLFHLLGSRLFEKYVLEIQTGLGVPHISGKQIQAFRFKMPSIVVQHCTVKNLDAMRAHCESLVASYQHKIALLDALQHSILQKGFAGMLTAQPEKALEEVAA